MAAVGEYFPQQFAASVLQIANSVKAREAELGEMRSQRAARNFLDQQRLALAQQGRQLSGGDSGGGDEDAAERAKFQREQATQRQEGLIAKSIAELNDKGMAYFGEGSEKALADFISAQGAPAAQGGKADTVTRDGRKFTVTRGELEKPDPNKVRYHQMRVGNGTMVIRVGGPKSMEYQQAEADLRLTNEKVATEHQKSLGQQALRDYRTARTSQIRNNIGAGNSSRFGRVLDTYNRQIEGRIKNLTRESMTTALDASATDKEKEAARKKLRQALDDPGSVLSPARRESYETANDVWTAAVKADADFLTGGGDPDKNTPVINTEGLDAMGVDVSQSPIDLAKDLNPDAPWDALSVNARFNIDGEAAEFHVDGTPGVSGFIPLNKAAYRASRRVDWKGRLSPYAAEVGWRPPTQKERAARLPKAGERPTPPTQEERSGLLPGAGITPDVGAIFNRSNVLVDQLATATGPDKERIRQELLEVRRQIEALKAR